MMRMCTRFFAVFGIAAMSLASLPAVASGGGEESPPEFNSPWGPVRPTSDLASGSLGVVESSWWRKPLLLAWYRFNGLPISSKVLDAFDYGTQSTVVSDGVAAWWAESKAVAGLQVPESVRADTQAVLGNRWDTFENCPGAAWDQARSTLADRSKAWGANSPALRDWLQVQHRVFARCPLGPTYFRKDLASGAQINPEYTKQFVLEDMTIPDAPAGAPDLLVKDRAYQRAVALMYQGHYKEAEGAFKMIAQDGKSPWQEWGMYLAFRSRLRNVQVTTLPDNTYDPCQAPECVKRRADERTLRETESRRLRDDIARALQAARSAKKPDEVRRLGDLDALVGARLDPSRRFVELAGVLTTPATDADEFRRAVTDYLLLHRQFAPSEPMGEWLAGLINGYDPTKAPCRIGNGEAKPQSNSPDSAETECRRLQWSQQSLRRFEQNPTQYAWLFSAAALARRNDPHVATLLAAMEKTPENHPGAATFMLQRLRLGGREDGLRLASALTKRPDITSDYSARNRVREYRLWHATSLSDFCRDAQREHGSAFDRDTLLRSQPPDPKAEPSWGWDYDTNWILNYELPHSALIATAQTAECLPSLRSLAASMAWSRAILRKDVAAARQAATVLTDTITPPNARVLAIADDTAFLLEAGLTAQAARTGGRCRIGAPKPDEYRPDYEEVIGNLAPSLGHYAKNMLTSERYAEWQRERKLLDALPDLDSVWMENVLSFAKAFPEDERVPSLLRDAVYRTRMNWCADDSAGQLSHDAFDLLKSKYPKSKEARTTKYWFKPKT